MAKERPWAAWAAHPEAITRARFLATTVSKVAPQIPNLPWSSVFGKRQGPIKQTLQQAPLLPIEQAESSSARLKQVETLSRAPFLSISIAAGSMLFFWLGKFVLSRVPIFLDIALSIYNIKT
jgi:hypothetical protein